MMGWRLTGLALVLLGQWSAVPAEETVPRRPETEAVLQAMERRPLEAFALARDAAGRLTDNPEQVRALFAHAARLQERRLAALTEAQVEELAAVYKQTLRDADAERRVRKQWLEIRRRALGPADGPGRYDLARLTYRWFRDRRAAAELCQQALALTPDLKAAARMLRDDLDYELKDGSWLPREQVRPTDRRRNAARVHPGMTPDEVRALLGRPDRIARQMLYRRYLEQWIYDDPAGLRVGFDCLKGQEPRVNAILPPVPPGP